MLSVVALNVVMQSVVKLCRCDLLIGSQYFCTFILKINFKKGHNSSTVKAEKKENSNSKLLKFFAISFGLKKVTLI
jgi:hypothetical protein